MIGFIGTLQSLLISIIITAHNQWLPKTPSIPYRTTNVFSSIVTDLVLIYEPVTSSGSIVCWLMLHSWTLNHNCNLTDFLFTTDDFLSTNESEWTLLYNLGRTKGRPPPWRVCLLLFVSQSRGNTFISTSVFIATKHTFNELLSSNGLFCHSIYIYIYIKHRFLYSLDLCYKGAWFESQLGYCSDWSC
jgi:hypothetical protein